MKQKRKLFSRVPTWVWVLSAVVLIVICILPFLFVQPGLLDFSETGQIGDTIGGTMGPFIAIVAAILTFIAFWVQYEANINQREDIAIERIEEKYYKMLDVYSAMTNNLNVHDVSGKEAFVELVGEFEYTFDIIDDIYTEISKDKSFLTNANESTRAMLANFNSDSERRYRFLTILAYNLFFYGRHYMIVDPVHPENTVLSEEIKKRAFLINQVRGNNTFSDYTKASNDNRIMLNFGQGFLMFEGHSDFLGHYYRHLYQMVKYVASLDTDLIDENEKYNYVKLLRSQMSDYEQILLYYNSLTEMGQAWNTSYGERFPEDACFLSRFRMIKNLPPNFPLFGIIPQYVYKVDSDRWRKLGKSFFEHRYLPISRRAHVERNVQ